MKVTSCTAEVGAEFVGASLLSLEKGRRNGWTRIGDLFSEFCGADLGNEVKPLIKVRIFGITFNLGGSVVATSSVPEAVSN